MKRRDTIVRCTTSEYINRWITVLCFILATMSGLGFLLPSFNQLMQIMGTPQLARILHPFVDVVTFTSFVIMFSHYWHHSPINRDDIFWAEDICETIVNGEVGDTGHCNSGQKCVFWAMITFPVLLLVSGVITWRPHSVLTFSIPVIRFALMLHSSTVVALIVVIMVHIRAALRVKGTIIAMVEGWVTSMWAKRHRPR